LRDALAAHSEKLRRDARPVESGASASASRSARRVDPLTLPAVAEQIEPCPYCGYTGEKVLYVPVENSRIFACPDCKHAWGLIGDWAAFERYAQRVSLDDS